MSGCWIRPPDRRFGGREGKVDPAADRKRDRRVRGVAGAVVAALGTGVIVGIAVVTAPFMLAYYPLAVLAGAWVAGDWPRGRDGGRERARPGLDAVDREAPPVRLGADVVRRVIGGAPRLTYAAS